MTDREKAIRILEGNYKSFVLRHNGELLTVNELIALLKAQQPRVMTLEEACSDIDLCWLEIKDYQAVWVSDCVIMPNGKQVLIERLGYDPVSFKPEEYGRTWRCWNTKPTNEQRKAVKWDDK